MLLWRATTVVDHRLRDHRKSLPCLQTFSMLMIGPSSQSTWQSLSHARRPQCCSKGMSVPLLRTRSLSQGLSGRYCQYSTPCLLRLRTRASVICRWSQSELHSQLSTNRLLLRHHPPSRPLRRYASQGALRVYLYLRPQHLLTAPRLKMRPWQPMSRRLRHLMLRSSSRKNTFALTSISHGRSLTSTTSRPTNRLSTEQQ
jgi:hypothetical protein